MVHNVLPTQERLHRILKSVSSPNCNLCTSRETCNLVHALFSCRHNKEVGDWLLLKLRYYIPNIVPQQVILLDLDVKKDLELPLVWLVAKTLNNIFNCRSDKKPCSVFTTRAMLEASIMLLRKTRFYKAAEKLQFLMA